MRACADSSMYTTWQFFVGPEQGLIIICLLRTDKYGSTLKMPIAGFS